MKDKEKKLYLVRREVYAHTLREAMEADGEIYSIELADEKNQPEEKETKKIGF